MGEQDRPAQRGVLWSAGCDGCGAITVVDGDGKEVPDPGDWDSFPKCLVCGGTLHFDEHAETTWQRESRLMRAAAQRAVERVTGARE